MKVFAGIFVILLLLYVIFKFPLIIIGLGVIAWGIFRLNKKPKTKRCTPTVIIVIGLVLSISGIGMAAGGQHKTSEQRTTTSPLEKNIINPKSSINKKSDPSLASKGHDNPSNSLKLKTTNAPTQTVPSSLTKDPAPSNLVAATVSKEVDGDTIHVNLNGKDEIIRMLLIDTPEDKDPRRPVEPFGYKAADYAASVLPVGKHIYLQLGKKGYERDKYDRLLAYVYITPTDMYNEDVVKKGLARVAYIYPPNIDHLSNLQAAQDYAKSHKLGIWSLSGFVTSRGYDLSISCSYAKKNGYSTSGCATTTTTSSNYNTTQSTTTATQLNVHRGDYASVTVKTTPGASGSIEVDYHSGPSHAKGLEPKTANNSGNITWSWRVGSSTTPGTYDVIIKANGTTIYKKLTVY